MKTSNLISNWMFRLGLLGLACLLSFNQILPALASTYANKGVRGKTITVCFVGDAVTKRAARVTEIMSDLKEYENAANIKFVLLDAVVGKKGQCPAPTTLKNGNDFYEGDIRVVIPSISVSGTGPIPGKDCPQLPDFLDNDGKYNGKNDGWQSFGMFPDEAKDRTNCLYNLKLGDDSPPGSSNPYLNHTLHEFGHALGLAHEHQRFDIDPACKKLNDQEVKKNPKHDVYGGNITTGLLTPYDRLSVMHYQFPECNIDGNYGNSGLSALDRLAIHILYPEDEKVAEFIGTTVIATNQSLNLRFAWKDEGANLNEVAKNFRWRINDVSFSTNPNLTLTGLRSRQICRPPQSSPFTAGECVSPRVGDYYDLEYTYNDFLNRTYIYKGKIRVLTPVEYKREISGSLAAQLPLA